MVVTDNTAMTKTTYLAFGGDDNLNSISRDILVDEDTFQVFLDPDKAEVYRQDLLNGTNNSGLRGDNAERAWIKYDHAKVRTFNHE